MTGTAFFDLDRTITFQGTWSRFVRFACKSDLQFSLGLPRMLVQAVSYKAGFANRASVKEKAIAQYLEGRSRKDLEEIACQFAIEEMRTGIRPGAKSAIAWHRSRGHRLVIASAAADLVVEPLAKKLGFDDIICTRLGWSEEDTLLPGLIGANCYGEDKFDRVKAFAEEEQVSGETWFYSDHVTDMPCLEWVDHGVAVNPSSGLKTAAMRNNLPIVDWTAIP